MTTNLHVNETMTMFSKVEIKEEISGFFLASIGFKLTEKMKAAGKKAEEKRWILLPSPRIEIGDAGIAEVVRATLEDVAVSIAKDAVGAKSVGVALTELTFSKLMERWKDDQLSRKVNGDQILQWFQGSEVGLRVMEKLILLTAGDEKKAEAGFSQVAAKLAGLSAPVPDINVKTCEQIFAFFQSEDSAHPIGGYCMKRLEKLIEKFKRTDLLDSLFGTPEEKDC